MKIQLGSLRTGLAGSARELLVTLEPTDPRDYIASIGTWFIEAPGQSPAWRHFVLSAIHLRLIEGVKPPVIREAGATHEFMMLALDPAKNPEPLNPTTWSFLLPFNLEEQVTVYSDAAAAQILDLCASNVAHGHLWAEPPLSGQVEPWRSFLQRLASQSTVAIA